MLTRLVWALLLLGLLAACSSPAVDREEQRAAEASIRGQVSSDVGVPAPAVAVTVLRGEEVQGQTQTDAQGLYRLRVAIDEEASELRVRAIPSEQTLSDVNALSGQAILALSAAEQRISPAADAEFDSSLLLMALEPLEPVPSNIPGAPEVFATPDGRNQVVLAPGVTLENGYLQVYDLSIEAERVPPSIMAAVQQSGNRVAPVMALYVVVRELTRNAPTPETLSEALHRNALPAQASAAAAMADSLAHSLQGMQSIQSQNADAEELLLFPVLCERPLANPLLLESSLHRALPREVDSLLADIDLDSLPASGAQLRDGRIRVRIACNGWYVVARVQETTCFSGQILTENGQSLPHQLLTLRLEPEDGSAAQISQTYSDGLGRFTAYAPLPPNADPNADRAYRLRVYSSFPDGRPWRALSPETIRLQDARQGCQTVALSSPVASEVPLLRQVEFQIVDTEDRALEAVELRLSNILLSQWSAAEALCQQQGCVLQGQSDAQGRVQLRFPAFPGERVRLNLRYSRQNPLNASDISDQAPSDQAYLVQGQHSVVQEPEVSFQRIVMPLQRKFFPKLELLHPTPGTQLLFDDTLHLEARYRAADGQLYQSDSDGVRFFWSLGEASNIVGLAGNPLSVSAGEALGSGEALTVSVALQHVLADGELLRLQARSQVQVAAVDLRLEPSPSSLLVGESVRLQASVTGANNQAVQWQSSDASIASIDAEGVVQALTPGQVQLQARSVVASEAVAQLDIEIRRPESSEAPLVALSQNLRTVRNTPLPLRLAAEGAAEEDLRFTLTRDPRHGRLEGTPPQLRYIPARDYVGSDSLLFSVEDGLGRSASAEVLLEVRPIAFALPNFEAQQLVGGETLRLPFNIINVRRDPNDGFAPDGLLLAAVSSDPTILPNSREFLHISGSGAAWELHITPLQGAVGQLTVSISAMDSVGNMVESSLLLEVLRDTSDDNGDDDFDDDDDADDDSDDDADDDSDDDDEEPLEPLTLLERNPAPDVSNVPLDTVLTLRFNRDVDSDSLKEAVQLWLDEQQKPLNLLSYDTDTLVAVFAPVTALQPEKRYELYLTTALRDAQGTALSAPKTWAFTTSTVLLTWQMLAPDEDNTDTAEVSAAVAARNDDLTLLQGLKLCGEGTGELSLQLLRNDAAEGEVTVAWRAADGAWRFEPLGAALTVSLPWSVAGFTLPPACSQALWLLRELDSPSAQDLTISVSESQGYRSAPPSVSLNFPADCFVQVPDPNLAAVLQQILGTSSSDSFSCRAMATLEFTLETNGKGISNLSGLEAATALRGIDLRNNAISDLSPLAGLTTLETLLLDNNAISDLSPLAGLTTLETLLLDNNSISDLSPLASLGSLLGLNLNDNAVSDLSPLQNLPLRSISLVNNAISSITPLLSITGLSGDAGIVDVRGNALEDRAYEVDIPELQARDVTVRFDPPEEPEPLCEVTFPDENLARAVNEALGNGSIADAVDCDALETLSLLNAPESGISNLSGLEAASNLLELFLEGNAISDLSPLAGLELLMTLSLTNNAISDLSPLQNLNLSELFLGDNAISDLSPLQTLPLTQLIVRNNAISDIAALSANLNLASGNFINLQGNPLGDTAYETDIPELQARGVMVSFDMPDDWSSEEPPCEVAFADDNLAIAVNEALGNGSNTDPVNCDALESLSFLIAPESGISNLSGLEAASNLLELFLEGNAISDLSPLAGLELLMTLSLTNNAISDLSPLQNLNVYELFLDNNAISDLTPLQNLTQIDTLSLAGNAISDLSPLGSMNALVSLRLSSNSINALDPLESIDMSSLVLLDLRDNAIVDLAALVENMSLTNTTIDLRDNPLGTNAPNDISILESRGATVLF